MWIAVVLASLGCYALKLAGVSLPQRVLEHPRAVRVAAILPVALLAALIATSTVTDGSRLVLDARAAGLAAAAVAVWRRAPFLVVVVLAAVVTALVRLA